MRYEHLVGVLTYARPELLAVALRSVREHTDLRKGILLVACNATDEAMIRQVEQLCAEHGAALVSFRKNRGTSAAWNAIARMYDCRRLAILNDDVRVYRGWQHAIDQTLDDPKMGAISLSFFTGDDWRRETGCDDASIDPMHEPLDRYYSAYPCGALLAMRRETFDRVGGFDEKLWIGKEEVDFGIRCWRAGLACANVGSRGERVKYAAHKGGGTGYASTPGDTVPPELHAVVARQREHFIQKHGVDCPLPETFERELTRRG